MKRALISLAAVLLLGVSSPVTISVHVQRNTLDLLDSLSIEIVAHNPTKTTATVRFALPEEYAIDVLRGHDVIWTSLPAAAQTSTVQSHSRSFAPGPTTLAIYDWNELASGGTSPVPGLYTIRVRLLDGRNESATLPVHFAEPVPVQAIAHLKPGDEITLAGTVDASLQRFTDGGGTVMLSRRLIGAGSAPIVVRGSIAVSPGGVRTLSVERWAPLNALQP